MGTARDQCRQNNQVPWREKPMFSLISKALGGACDKAQPMTLRQIVEMFGTNSRKVRNLGISEDLLARFDGYHWFNSSQFLQSSTLKTSDAMQRLRSPEISCHLYGANSQYFKNAHTSGTPRQKTIISAASTWVPEMLNSVVASRRANKRLTAAGLKGKCRPALSLIGPVYVGHLVCQEGAAQLRDK